MIGATGAFYIARILWPMFQPDIARDIESMRDRQFGDYSDIEPC
jgi:hypothetical protein